MKKNKAIALVGLLFCLIGLSAWIYQWGAGLGVTNLRNIFPWGLYIVLFEFFVGAAAGSMLLFSLAYVLRAKRLKPLAPLAALTSLGCTIAAGASILPDIGRVTKIFRVLISPNLRSPLVWDMAVLTVFVAVAALVAVFQLRIAVRGEDRTAEAWSGRLAVLALPLSLALSVVTALLFSTQQSYPWWNPVLLPIDTAAVGYALGGALVILISLLVSDRAAMARRAEAYRAAAMIAALCLLAHCVLAVIELAELLHGGTAAQQALRELVLVRYGWMYWPALILPVLALVLFLRKKTASGVVPLTVSGLLVVAGALLHKGILLPPAFNSVPLTLSVDGAGQWSVPVALGTFTEGSAVFVRSLDYVPAAVEWAVALLPVGIVLTVVAGAAAIFPRGIAMHATADGGR